MYPASHTATKVFEFLERFGVGATGQPFVDGAPNGVPRSIGSLIRRANKSLAAIKGKPIKTCANRLAEFIHQHVGQTSGMIELLVCGYQNDVPVSVTARITKDGVSLEEPNPGLGIAVIGEGFVGQALWDLATARKTEPAVLFCSLRDAIDHGTFLVAVTRDYQRFFQEPQTVGGGIDVATITRQEEFTWVKRSSHVQPEK